MVEDPPIAMCNFYGSYESLAPWHHVNLAFELLQRKWKVP
jgi:hypothetical protein